MPFAAVAFLLFIHYWGEVERHRFEARVDALRAAGQPVRYEDLETPPVADEENAAEALAKAAQTLAELKQTEPFSSYFGPPDPDVLDEQLPEEREEARAYLRSLKPYFDQLAEATKRPRWHVDHEWRKGPEHKLPELSLLQDATSYLHWRVALDPDDKGWAACAADATILVMDIGERWHIPFVIGDLCSRIPSSAYPAIYLRRACGSPSNSRPLRPAFDAALFRRLVDPRLAKAARATGPSRAAFAQERVFTIWLVRALGAGGKTPLDEWLPLNGVHLKHPVWRPFLYRDANRALDLHEEAIALAETSPEEALRGAEKLKAKYATKDPTYYLTQYTIAARAFEKYAENVAVQRLTRVVMALLEYHQRKGFWPESLDVLGEMPSDPYSGKPFLYEPFMDTGVRIRAAKPSPPDKWDDWEQLEEDHLAWTFKE